MKCIFCEIIKNNIPAQKIWEDENFLAFLDIQPINPGHTLLIPKKHDDNVFEIPDSDFNALFLAAKKLAPHIQKVTSARRVGLIVEGFGVPHAHIHLVPINNPRELDPLRAKKATDAELDEMQKLLIQS